MAYKIIPRSMLQSLLEQIKITEDVDVLQRVLFGRCYCGLNGRDVLGRSAAKRRP